MRRSLIVLVVAAATAVAVGQVGAARSGAPAWLQTLAQHDAAALGDAKPGAIVYRFAGSSATVVLHGRFVCSHSNCPFPLTGPIASVRGTIATIRVDLQTRKSTGFALTYPLLVVGPASAPSDRIQIDFSAAAPGPATAFSFLRHHAGLNQPGAQSTISARARRIATLYAGGRDHVLLVAPTKAGGFCTSFSGPYGGTGCPFPTALRVGSGVLDPGATGDASGPILLDGYFTVANAARLQVTYQDGSTATIPFVWVSKPINAGLFVYDLAAHRRPGHRPDTLTLFNSQGTRLDSQHIT